MQDTNRKAQSNLPFKAGNEEASTIKTYTEEFKRGLVDRVMGGKSALSLSREVGIPQTTISRWVKIYGITGGGINPAQDEDKRKDEMIKDLILQNNILMSEKMHLEKIVLGYIKQIPVTQLTNLLHADEEAS